MERQNVLVFLNSIHKNGRDEEEKFEMVASGRSKMVNGGYYVTYEELAESGIACDKSLIKISKDRVELIRRGGASVHMIFERGKKNYASYDMEMGSMRIGLDTDRMEVLEEKDRVLATLEYRLEMEEQYIADCKVEIIVDFKADPDRVKLTGKS